MYADGAGSFLALDRAIGFFLLCPVAFSVYFGRIENLPSKAGEVSLGCWRPKEQGCDLSESIVMGQNLPVSQCQVGVGNVLGLHLRVADRFVKLANTFQSEVRVQCRGIIANGKSILALLTLAAECGTMVALEAQGCDAEDAVVALANLISGESSDSADHRGEVSYGAR
jgi:phosphocarrier protein